MSLSRMLLLVWGLASWMNWNVSSRPMMQTTTLMLSKFALRLAAPSTPLPPASTSSPPNSWHSKPAHQWMQFKSSHDKRLSGACAATSACVSRTGWPCSKVWLTKGVLLKCASMNMFIRRQKSELSSSCSKHKLSL